MWLLILEAVQEKFPVQTHAGFTQKSQLNVHQMNVSISTDNCDIVSFRTYNNLDTTASVIGKNEFN